MSNYTARHFTACRFNPLVEGDILQAYPELGALLPDDNQWNDRRMRYIILMYDPKSPLVREFVNLDVRKQRASEIAGFDLVADQKVLDRIWALKDKITLPVIEAYLKDFVQSREWAMITSFEQTWWELNARMLKRIESEDDREEMMAVEKKEKIRKEMEALHGVLDTLYDKFFHGDQVLIESATRRLTPEEIALKAK